MEIILDDRHRSPSFRAFSDKDKNAEALIAGAYVGEVIRRNHGGYWSTHSEAAGEFSFPLHTLDKNVFPYMWCLKRLVNGREDNVWHKYLGVALGISNTVLYSVTYRTNLDSSISTNTATSTLR